MAIGQIVNNQAFNLYQQNSDEINLKLNKLKAALKEQADGNREAMLKQTDRLVGALNEGKDLQTVTSWASMMSSGLAIGTKAAKIFESIKPLLDL